VCLPATFLHPDILICTFMFAIARNSGSWNGTKRRLQAYYGRLFIPHQCLGLYTIDGDARCPYLVGLVQNGMHSCYWRWLRGGGERGDRNFGGSRLGYSVFSKLESCSHLPLSQPGAQNGDSEGAPRDRDSSWSRFTCASDTRVCGIPHLYSLLLVRAGVSHIRVHTRARYDIAYDFKKNCARKMCSALDERPVPAYRLPETEVELGASLIALRYSYYARVRNTTVICNAVIILYIYIIYYIYI
jgi:hypothetical protein